MLHVFRLLLELILGYYCEHEPFEAQELQVGSVVPQQMGNEFLGLAELSSTDHAEVPAVVLEPAVDLPGHLAGEEARFAMPALLRS